MSKEETKEYKAYTVSLNGVVKYVGVTTRSISRRWIEHQQPGSPCKFLLRAIVKYGRKAFTVTHVASSLSKDGISEIERALIAQYRTMAPYGYNLLPGGLSAFKVPAPIVEKIRLKHIGRKRPPMSAEQRAKISESLRGRKRSPEAIEKSRLANLGKKRSPEATARLRAALCGRVIPPEESARRSAANRARGPMSSETRKRVSAGKRGKKIFRSKKHNAKIAEANRGRVLSPETRAKLSSAQRARYSRERNNNQQSLSI